MPVRPPFLNKVHTEVIVTGTDEFVIYGNFENGEPLKAMSWVLNNYKSEPEAAKKRLYECIHGILKLAADYGLRGNLWQDYLTLLLVSNENVFSIACEIRGMPSGTLPRLARHDFEIFRALFTPDFDNVENTLSIAELELIMDYKRCDSAGKLFNRRVRDRICTLSEQLAAANTTDEFMRLTVDFYGEFGVGKLGLHKAFRISHDESDVVISPITNIAHVSFDDLVGYEDAKQRLIENTEAFVRGSKANNCLLFGDAGTGKSSSIKAILNKYYDRGLRIIEVYKHQFRDLNEVIAQIKNRNYRFIIYMDDLSFEEFETEYKYLKAVIEGGLEKKPENVLIYATSNRRHLIRETFSDRAETDGDIHGCDTVQEKLSLVARFGVSIYFGAPDRKQYLNIVRTLALRGGVNMDESTLELEANRWESRHGGLSGRTAQQFVDYLLGKEDNY